MAQLAADNGYSAVSVYMTIASRKWPAVEQIISSFIDVPAKELWPDRYSQDNDA